MALSLLGFCLSLQHKTTFNAETSLQTSNEPSTKLILIILKTVTNRIVIVCSKYLNHKRFCMSIFVTVPCDFWSALYIVVCDGAKQQALRLPQRAFQCNNNTEVYWLPRAGGKENPAARQLVLFTFTYGDTRKKQAQTTAGNHQDEKLRLWAFPPLLNPPRAQ